MLIAVLVIVGVVVIGLGVAILKFEPGRREAMAVVVNPLDFSTLSDGVYTGEYIGTKDHMRDAKVEVTVTGGKVEDIDVLGGALANEKQNTKMRNGQSINDLFDAVIAAQSLQVDVISGATITSKVHLKAVENALVQAENE